jgi:hypothetical protein
MSEMTGNLVETEMNRSYGPYFQILETEKYWNNLHNLGFFNSNHVLQTNI